MSLFLLSDFEFVVSLSLLYWQAWPCYLSTACIGFMRVDQSATRFLVADWFLFTIIPHSKHPLFLPYLPKLEQRNKQTVPRKYVFMRVVFCIQGKYSACMFVFILFSISIFEHYFERNCNSKMHNPTLILPKIA